MTIHPSKPRKNLLQRMRSVKLRNKRGHKYKLSGWHPIAVPVFTFALLVGVSVIALGVSLIKNDEAPRSNAMVVIITHDKKQQIVPSREQTVGSLLKRLDISLSEGDRVEPAREAMINQDDFRINIYRAVPVQVVDGATRTTTFSAATTARSIAKQAGMVVYPEDRVEAMPIDNILRDQALGEKIVINRATATSMNLYGTPVNIRTHAKTVGELLKEKKIKLAKDDTVTPARSTPLTPATQVFVTRNGVEIASTEEIVPAPITTVEDGNLTFGTSAVRQEGASGKRLVTYEIIKKNGVETSRRLIQETIVQAPVERIVVKGTKFVISNPSENVKIGERLAAQRGWTGEEFQCLYNLWQKESGWRHTAANPSGAYGIPQALPGSKMASAGADWQTNPETQIKWGMGYIAGRYSTPCGAWAKSKASGWY